MVNSVKMIESCAILTNKNMFLPLEKKRDAPLCTPPLLGNASWGFLQIESSLPIWSPHAPGETSFEERELFA